MDIYELKIELYLNKEFGYKDFPNFVSKNINYMMYNSLLLRALHEKKGFKPFVVGSLYPAESKDKIYKIDKKYIWTIRSLDKTILEEFLKAYKSSTNLDFTIAGYGVHKLEFKNGIDRVFTITPAVLTVKASHFWTIEDDILLIQKRVIANLEKKYFEFFKKRVTAPKDAINFFHLKNQKPIFFNYKNRLIIANRFEFIFNSDEISQTLAKLSFGVGILEKNTLGFGMVMRGRNVR
jgi:CRISPR-associated endoribonuclease Cas6